jgi:amino acid transporter
MKTRLLHLALLSLPLVLISLSVNSQTVAIGHVSAEVVEAVGASSNLSTGFDVDQSLIGSQAGIIDLGSIELNSGVDLSCSLTVARQVYPMLRVTNSPSRLSRTIKVNGIA